MNYSDNIDKSIIEFIMVVMAPSREAAIPIIVDKHTNTMVKPWSPLMQAEYYDGMIKEGKSKQYISEICDISISDIDTLLRMLKMHALISLLNLPVDILIKANNKEKFQISTLKRLYDHRPFRLLIGLSDDFENIENIDNFKLIFSKVITDIVLGNEDSRTLDKDTDRERYCNILSVWLESHQTPQVKDTGNNKPQNISDLIEGQPPIIPPAPSPIPTGLTRSPKKEKSIIPSKVKFHLDNATSLKRLFDEIKSIPVKYYPNSSSIAFRVFFEKCLRYLLKSKKIRTVPTYDSKGRILKDEKLADTTLKNIIDFLTRKTTTIIEDDNIKKCLRIFSQSSEFASLSTMNSIVHNEELCFNEDQAHNLWPNLESLITMIISKQ